MPVLELTGTAKLSSSAVTAKPGAVAWRYDDTTIKLIGPHTTRICETNHVGEHHVADYKGHKLRVLRVVKKLWPDEAHSELVQEWHGEVDGVAIDGMVNEHSSVIAEALQAHVDAL